MPGLRLQRSKTDIVPQDVRKQHSWPVQGPEDSINGENKKKKRLRDFFKRKDTSDSKSISDAESTFKALHRKQMAAISLHSSNDRQQQQQQQQRVGKFDISDSAIEAIMGKPKGDMASGGRSSDTFILKQRIHANSSAKHSPSNSIPQPLDRKVLTHAQVESLFAGAPTFAVEQRAGQQTPKVSFKAVDASLAARYSKDHKVLEHESFNYYLPYRTAAGTRNADRMVKIAQKSNDPVENEANRTLSTFGADSGSIGWEDFVRNQIAKGSPKAAQPQQWKDLSIGPSDYGLHSVPAGKVFERLAKLAKLHALSDEELAIATDEAAVKILGVGLFADFLTRDSTIDLSLASQIEALLKVLGQPNIWYDLSSQHWRSKIPQLLWDASSVAKEMEDINGPAARNLLLLQTVLAAELLVRIEIAEVHLEVNEPSATSTSFDSEPALRKFSSKVKWDLLNAGRLLESFEFSTFEANTDDYNSEILRRESGFDLAKSQYTSTGSPLLTPKDLNVQLEGLEAFANAISWPINPTTAQSLTAPSYTANLERSVTYDPNIKTHRRGVSDVSMRSTASNHQAPSKQQADYLLPPIPATGSRPLSTATAVTMFETSATSQNQQQPALQDKAQFAIDIARKSGFARGSPNSKSWLSGFMLPGFAIGDALMQTLLENSMWTPQGTTGGFVYQGRTFLPRTLIAARVLAVMEGASDSMGWVSLPSFQGLNSTNVQSLTKKLPTPSSRIRPGDMGMVTINSDPLHGSSSAQALDFIDALDSPPVMGNEVRLDRVVAVTNPENDDQLVMQLSFSSPLNIKLSRLEVPLLREVQFISSYPCHPLANTETPCTNGRPTSPAPSNDSEDPLRIKRKDSGLPTRSPLSWEEIQAAERALPPTPAHPLHVDYRYTTIPIATLLSMRDGPEHGAKHSRKFSAHGSSEEEVAVLDCRGAKDLEILARAWCSKVGEHAIIGKSGRTCLACCIREARALGICAVIRT